MYSLYFPGLASSVLHLGPAAHHLLGSYQGHANSSELTAESQTDLKERKKVECTTSLSATRERVEQQQHSLLVLSF